MSAEKEYMGLALDLALKGRGKTHPNPMVGAVLVSSGKIIGRGFHKGYGSDHAEVEAIRSVKKGLKNSTMFVTLEPCDHFGKTPPCTEAIIKSGIKKVYCSIKDPNPLNAGRGVRKLRKNGIEVHTGLLCQDALDINRAYIKFITRGMPYVTIKLAQSVDGKLAAKDGSSKWISSSVSRKIVKKMRTGSDAVLTGINTVLKDDPTLMGLEEHSGKPARIVLDSRLRIKEDCMLIRTAVKAPLFVVTTQAASKSKKKRIAGKKGVEVIEVKSCAGKVDLKSFFKEIACRGIIDIMVEGGAEISGALIDGDFVDEAVFFIAPMIIGGSCKSLAGKGAPNICDVITLRQVERKFSGPDILVKGKIYKK